MPKSHSSTLFLCGGGTGGHVYPALAVAEALQQPPRGTRAGSASATLLAGRPAQPVAMDGLSAAGEWPVVYVGSEDGMEVGLVSRESQLPYRAIPAAALRGRAPWTLARNLGILARGTLAARRLIAQERPAAILGTGGYVCVPLFLAARAAGVPTAIYLPDVVPGMAIRLLARLSTTIACNVEDSIAYFRPSRSASAATRNRSASQPRRPTIVVTGYPVRRELFEQDRAACRAAFDLDESLPALFVYGGSRGARSVNKAIAALLEHLLPLVQIIHVCGREGDETFLREAAAQVPEQLRSRYRLYPYLYSDVRQSPDGNGQVGPTMVQAFGAADLVVCRSGASTLGELPAAALPAVLVPYPYVHQDENADYLVRHGAALKVQDHEMLGAGRPEEGPLFRAIHRLLRDPQERVRMSERSRSLARPDAAEQLAQLLLGLATSKRS